MATKVRAIILMVLCTILISSAQVLYKFGASKISFDPSIFLTNYPVMMGLGLYVIGVFIFVKALKEGDLSVLYPVIATSYIWVSLGSMFFFNEPMNVWKWIGVFLIVFGVSIIGFSGKKDAIKHNIAVS